MTLKPYTPHEFKIMRVRECLPMTETVDTPERAAAYWRANIPQAPWFDPAKEAVVVLVLNTRRRILGHNLVTLGSLDTCIVTPLSVFRPVIVMAGSAIILMHQHPSGDCTPSEGDIRVTRDLIRAGQLLKIDLVDHVIIGEPNHASLRNMGYFSI
ncbi:JAB domain-containing protein [Fontisphaera persica]|uniref:JAB domain-containing protein n=1 Tax=Fontisphaera persica TaxID=2974023 RepID=UPI0024BFE286|nr:JAB domain-containing protein [Fontisphaera persica]WCJ60705.1 JAB domain-containing protein [Fontisphaera persica]